MDMISVEFKAQRIAPNPTKSKLFSVLIVWPESSRKPCKIDLAYKSSKILCMNRVHIIEGFVTKAQNLTRSHVPYVILRLPDIINWNFAMFKSSIVTTCMWLLNKALLHNHFPSASDLKALCTSVCDPGQTSYLTSRQLKLGRISLLTSCSYWQQETSKAN